MDGSELFNLPLEVQIALGGGYLGYRVAYSGLQRGHSPTDATMLSLAFGLVGVAVFRLAGVLPGAWAIALGIPAAVLATAAAGAAWRAKGRALAADLLQKARVHQDDGLYAAWDTLIQERGLSVTQARVITRDGRDLHCASVGRYRDGPGKGLILGCDGGIVMVVEEEEATDGEIDLDGPARTAIVDPDWGTRLTYIPADMIARAELRCR